MAGKKAPDPERSARMKRAWATRRAREDGKGAPPAGRELVDGRRLALELEVDTADRILAVLRPLPPASRRAVLDYVVGRKGARE